MKLAGKIIRMIFILTVFMCKAHSGFSQAQFVLNGAYTVLNGGTSATPIYLVIHNGASSGIKYNSGGILSESEYNMVWWDIGAAVATTSYVVPFYYYPSSSYIPLTFTIGTAGTGSGAIKFSTWHGNSTNCNGFGANVADNYCYKPSDVNNMYPAKTTSSPGGATNDNSYYVVDRFWVIDNTGYTSKPDPQIKFTYLNSTNAASEVAAPNQSIDGTLIAQRYNSSSKIWGDYMGQSGTTAVTGTTSTVQTGTVDVTSAGFYRSWTLSGTANPLPIELASFDAECHNYYALIQWTTATESDNDHFTVERTQDGVNYQEIAIVPGAGNSRATLSYSVKDNEPLNGISYYRLSQTDKDGKQSHLNVAVYKPCENVERIYAFNNGSNNVNIQINAIENNMYSITLMDVSGRVVLSTTRNAVTGLNDYRIPVQVNRGVYILRIAGTSTVYTKKMILGEQ